MSLCCEPRGDKLPAIVDANKLLTSYAANGVLGRLSGAQASDVDRFFREEHARMQAELRASRDQAREREREISLDFSRLSGVNAGDWLRISPDGAVTRQFENFPRAEAFIQDTSDGGDLPACPSLERARALLLRCAYNGLWSPSGTNWQPIRTLELTPAEAAEMVSVKNPGCGLLVLARSRYRSILSDVAMLCGLEPASRAESIDLGIWLVAAGTTARAHGWGLVRHPIEFGARGRVLLLVAKLLAGRRDGLSEPSREAIDELLLSCAAGDHYPYCVLTARQGRALAVGGEVPGGLVSTDFDRLVEARSTQRVASPNADLDRELLTGLFESARDLHDLPEDALEFPVFTRQDEFPALLGAAMHEGIEGPDGLLSRIGLDGLRSYLETLSDLPDEVALSAKLVPEHIRAKLLSGGHFHIQGDLLIDHRGKPLSPVRFVKLVRMMARAFGKFFLGFQNTHPLTGVILVRSDLGPAVYLAAGRVLALMTFLARARGLTSIIKSGPIEIAGAAVKDILAGQLSDAKTRERLSSGLLEPVCTFQVGLPLGPDEMVLAASPAEHNGLAERLLDKRAPRARLSAHYIPAG